MKPLPQAVIVGFEANGLGLARALHARGIGCIGVDVPVRRPEYATRSATIVHCAAWSESALIDRLVSIGSDLTEKAPILITKDEGVLWISKHRDILEKYFEIVLPTDDVVQLLMDKSLFQETALANRWPVPRTTSVNSLAELEQSLDEIVYPSILKPAVRNKTFRENSAIKVFTLESEARLLDCYRTVAQWESSVVIQELIEGGDDRIGFCLAYYSRDHEPLAMFVGQKLVQYPVGFGNTAVSVPAPPAWQEILTSCSQAIFAKLGYQGLGSIEYKMREDGTPVIMEPTVGRSDWQNEVAVLNGVDIPTVAYFDALRLPRESTVRKTPRTRLIDQRMYRKSRRQMKNMGIRPPKARTAAWRGRKRYMIWRLSDPGPFFADSLVRPVRRLLRLSLTAVRKFLPSPP